MHRSISSPCVILLSSVLRNIKQGIRPHRTASLWSTSESDYMVCVNLYYPRNMRRGIGSILSLCLNGIAAKLNQHMAGNDLNCLCMEKEGREWVNSRNKNVICT